MIWLLAWTLSTVAPSWSQAPDPALSCMQDGAEQCKDARFQFPKIGNDDFAKIFEVRRIKFAEWMKPVALFIQGVTGLPASVVIAQAGLASDWGASPAFRNNNNIFKHMCWVPNSTISGELQMGGRKFTYKGSCGSEKTFGQIGRPFKFASREDSILAYLHLILLSPSKQYKAAQEDIKRGAKMSPPRQSSFRSISGVLTQFSTDGKYNQQLMNMIQVEKLPTLDTPNCWQCLLPKPMVSQ